MAKKCLILTPSMKQFLKNTVKRLLPFAITKNQKYDRDTKIILSKNLKPNSNSIDIGCHKGEVLDEIIKYAPNGKHFGVEPIPFLAKLLREKYQNRATILEFALNEKGGEELEFVLVKSNPAFSGLKERQYEKKEELEKIKVQTARLDEIIPHEIKIDLIKIDVEGAEYGVLLGAEKLLQKDKPILIFEHGLGAADKYQTTPEMIFDYLIKFNYRLSLLNDFIKNKNELNRNQFCDEFYKSKNYYFIAW